MADQELKAETLRIGGKYNWKNQPERLIYMGMCEPRNGRWHQFALVESPTVCWCEVLPNELDFLEETRTLSEPVGVPTVQAGEWIDWGGGDRPVPSNTIVEMRRNDRIPPYDISTKRAGNINWHHENWVAYRVAAPSQPVAGNPDLQPVREALVLMNSMIACGEDHSDNSRAVLANAFKLLTTANAGKETT